MTAAKAVHSAVASSRWHFDGAVHEGSSGTTPGLGQVVGDPRSWQYCAKCSMWQSGMPSLGYRAVTILRNSYDRSGSLVNSVPT